jgi:hypothetical protein
VTREFEKAERTDAHWAVERADSSADSKVVSLDDTMVASKVPSWVVKTARESDDLKAAVWENC